MYLTVLYFYKRIQGCKFSNSSSVLHQASDRNKKERMQVSDEKKMRKEA